MNRGKIYKEEEGLEGYNTLNWYDSRGKYIGYDIIDPNGIAIQSFVSFLEV